LIKPWKEVPDNTASGKNSQFCLDFAEFLPADCPCFIARQSLQWRYSSYTGGVWKNTAGRPRGRKKEMEAFYEAGKESDYDS
jgi:hypothetical protein